MCEEQRWGKIEYILPDEKSTVLEVLSLIPSRWSGKGWIDAKFTATRELYEQGDVVENTRIILSSSILRPVQIFTSSAYDIPYEVVVEGEDPEKTQRGKIGPLTRFNRALFSTGLPSSFQLKKIGDHHARYVFEYAKDTMFELISRGYKGDILVVSGEEEGYNPENIWISHEDSRVVLEWNIEAGGRRKNLEKLIRKFGKLGLEKISERGERADEKHPYLGQEAYTY